MSQAMLMRIINLEKRVDELEKRLEPPAIISAAETAEWQGSTLDLSTEWVDSSGETSEPPKPWPVYQLAQNGPGWFRVFGPNGEITEKGLRRHEAQALVDDLNAQSQAG